MQSIKGIPASPGIASGPAFIYHEQEIKIERVAIGDHDGEWARLENALSSARTQLAKIQEKAAEETSEEEAAIFEAHAMFLDDPSLLDEVRLIVKDSSLNIESAWDDAIESNARDLEAVDDEYFRARAADIRDVGQRVLRNMMGIPDTDLAALKEPSIIIARDLTPSDTVRLDKEFVLAFCTAEGGPTSHTAILAKALALPAVVGAGRELLSIENGATLLVDGSSGEIVHDPDQATIVDYEGRAKAAAEQTRTDLDKAFEPAVTLDGHQVEIVANVGNPEDTKSALDHGAEGIGLLRTEFLYIERNEAPDEAEQLEAYNAILDLMEDRPVIVRTLDVGGDKELPYLDLGDEANPFLGWRAIRMCLDQPDFFKIQLRALLRASPGHDLRIMFPMIATLGEVRRSRELLYEARKEVEEAGQPVAGLIQLGIMVEIPSVVVLADQFAKEVDFFSIGTNDLTQYTLAAERTNEKVSHLGDACHPAVLREIKRVIEEAHVQGIWVGLCGELAGDPEAVPILLGFQLDEFSMAPVSIPRAKSIIRSWSLAGAKKLSEKVIDLDSAAAVRALVKEQSPG